MGGICLHSLSCWAMPFPLSLRFKEESDIDSFLGGGQMSFLTNEIKGLDDFELICFLVVR